MKEILIDIKDMSDSREIYQSKPHPFLWIFTYILLILIGSAVLWASIGKIEIVVKANGQVRPQAGISTVRNLYGGVVQELEYEQGDAVKKGDLLYSIEHDALLVEKDNLNRQVEDLKKELDCLNQYRKSILSETNTFIEAVEPMYFQKVHKLLLEIEFSKNDANYKVTKLREENGINRTQLARYTKERAGTEAYIKSLDENKNLLGSDSEVELEYRRKFEKYLIACRDYNRKFDEQSNQFKASNYEALKISLENEKLLKEAYSVLLGSIQQGKSLFQTDSKYAHLYNDYIAKKRDLKNQYDEAKGVYEAYKAMELYGASKLEIENARIQMEKIEGAYLSFEKNYISEIEKTIKEKEISIIELDGRISGSFDRDTLLKLNEEDRQSALKKLYLDERQGMLDFKEKITDSISTLSLSIKLGEAELRLLEGNKEGIAAEESGALLIEKMKTQEIVATDERIKAISENIKLLEQNIKKTDLDIGNARVTASIDGTVNILFEVLPGDFVSVGQELLTIIPDDESAYTMQIYVSNKDIGEIKVNDTVKYNFAALPEREYGEMRGQIVSISKDAMMSEADGQSFYAVKATIPGTKLIGSSGKQGEIKVGMICEASVITKQKSFLRYFLEKIDLLD